MLWLVIAVVIGIVIYVRKRKKQKKELLISEANALADRIKKDKVIPEISTGVFLDNGERAHLEESVQMLETRAIRKSSGGFGGIRIMKGITVGRYSGTSESHQEWRTIDSGKLTLTNKRIIFDGQKGNKVILISKIMSIDTALNTIQLSMEDRAKDVAYQVSNGYVWSLLLNILKQTKGDPDATINLETQFS